MPICLYTLHIKLNVFLYGDTRKSSFQIKPPLCSYKLRLLRLTHIQRDGATWKMLKFILRILENKIPYPFWLLTLFSELWQLFFILFVKSVSHTHTQIISIKIDISVLTDDTYAHVNLVCIKENFYESRVHWSSFCCRFSGALLCDVWKFAREKNKWQWEKHTARERERERERMQHSCQTIGYAISMSLCVIVK